MFGAGMIKIRVDESVCAQRNLAKDDGRGHSNAPAEWTSPESTRPYGLQYTVALLANFTRRDSPGATGWRDNLMTWVTVSSFGGLPA